MTLLSDQTDQSDRSPLTYLINQALQPTEPLLTECSDIVFEHFLKLFICVCMIIFYAQLLLDMLFEYFYEGAGTEVFLIN